MRDVVDSFLRRIQKTHGCKFSTVAQVKDEQINTQVCSFRTLECDPSNHNMDHFARIYTVPQDVQQQIFQYGLPPPFKQYTTTFQECSILIRQPAIEIISYLKQADYTRPVNKYILCILSYYSSSKLCDICSFVFTILR
jgi:hypothetical protein